MAMGKMHWNKIRIPLAFVFVIWFTFSLLIVIINYVEIGSQNKIRESIFADPVSTKAVVTEVSRGSKKSLYAAFKFNSKEQVFVGKTLHAYQGNVGDSICVLHNKQTPVLNVSCSEAPIQDIKETVLYSLLPLTGIMLVCLLVVVPCILIWGKNIRSKWAQTGTTSQKD